MMTDSKTCETCAYFVQHYRKDKEKYHPVSIGHCTFPRVKPRRMETAACGHYRERAPEQG